MSFMQPEDESAFEIIIRDGTAHRYCESAESAQALVAHIQSVCGAAWERDGKFAYCKFGYSDMDDARDCAPEGTSDADLEREMQRLEDQARTELDGFSLAD